MIDNLLFLWWAYIYVCEGKYINPFSFSDNAKSESKNKHNFYIFSMYTKFCHLGEFSKFYMCTWKGVALYVYYLFKVTRTTYYILRRSYIMMSKMSLFFCGIYIDFSFAFSFMFLCTIIYLSKGKWKELLIYWGWRK